LVGPTAEIRDHHDGFDFDGPGVGFCPEFELCGDGLLSLPESLPPYVLPGVLLRTALLLPPDELPGLLGGDPPG